MNQKPEYRLVFQNSVTEETFDYAACMRDNVIPFMKSIQTVCQALDRRSPEPVITQEAINALYDACDKREAVENCLVEIDFWIKQLEAALAALHGGGTQPKLKCDEFNVLENNLP